MTYRMFSQAEQRRTAERNQLLINAAERLGYEVVDTFGMTVSRYKDFLLGNCGCHFHKVTVDFRRIAYNANIPWLHSLVLGPLYTSPGWHLTRFELPRRVTLLQSNVCKRLHEKSSQAGSTPLTG